MKTYCSSYLEAGFAKRHHRLGTIFEWCSNSIHELNIFGNAFMLMVSICNSAPPQFTLYFQDGISFNTQFSVSIFGINLSVFFSLPCCPFPLLFLRPCV